jgi:hypothetical protein
MQKLSAGKFHSITLPAGAIATLSCLKQQVCDRLHGGPTVAVTQHSVELGVTADIADIARPSKIARFRPKATDFALQRNVRFRGYGDRRRSAPETSKLF